MSGVNHTEVHPELCAFVCVSVYPVGVMCVCVSVRFTLMDYTEAKVN